MITTVLFAITGLFISGLIAKKLLSLKICLICGSVVVTWMTLFVLYRAGYFHDPVLLSLLMGQSVTGLFYFTEKRVPQVLRVFTLPFFLTLTVIFYYMITPTKDIFPALFVLLGLWVVAYTLFAWRNDSGKKQLTDAVMHCCEDK